MKIGAIIQARMGSTRLPGKVLMDLGGWPVLKHVVMRLRRGVGPHIPIWIATPDDEIIKFTTDLNKKGYPVQGWRDGGDPNDVLGRYARIATEKALDGILRVTGDCPLLDPKPISDVLYLFQTLLYDYVANDIEATWPDGLGVEIFSIGALRRADIGAEKAHEREHVTPYMKKDRRNSKRNISCPVNGMSDLKLSIDTQADLDFVRAIDAAGPLDYSLLNTLEAIARVQAENLAEGA